MSQQQLKKKKIRKYTKCEVCSKEVRQDRFKDHRCKTVKMELNFICEQCHPPKIILKKNKARHMKLHSKKIDPNLRILRGNEPVLFFKGRYGENNSEEYIGDIENSHVENSLPYVPCACVERCFFCSEVYDKHNELFKNTLKDVQIAIKNPLENERKQVSSEKTKENKKKGMKK